MRGASAATLDDIIGALRSMKDELKATKDELKATNDELKATNAKIDSGFQDVAWRLDRMNPVGAAEALRKYCIRVHADTAPAGFDFGGTWTRVRSGSRYFALSAYHVAQCYRSLQPNRALVVVPSCIAESAVAVGLFDGLLSGLLASDGPDDAAAGEPYDVIAIELDPKCLTADERRDAFPLNGPLPANELIDMPLVGWSEQMPLSGRMLGTAGGALYFAEGDGCVSGNSGALMCPVSTAV